MKKLLLLCAAVIVAASCSSHNDTDEGDDGNGDGKNEDGYVFDSKYWYEAADSSSQTLIDRFWPPLLTRISARPDTQGYWHFCNGSDYASDPNNNYWPQAHAMDVVIDAYMRCTDPEKKEYWFAFFEKWFTGVPLFQYGEADGWYNPFVDDMEWMVLTHLRMYEAVLSTKPELAAKYLSTAQDIYDRHIWTAWSEEFWCKGGGILWSHSMAKSKNACSNAPAIIIACKLHKYTGGEDYLTQAIKIYDWMNTTLVTNSGAVLDHINSSGELGNYSLTYNQGTWLGGCLLLYQITGDKKYLTKAASAADFTINTMQTSNPKVLRDEGSGNNGLFKGIFVKYLVQLINEEDLDSAKRRKYRDQLTNWANIVWKQSAGINKTPGTGTMLFGSDWTKAPSGSSVLTDHLSGCMLIEAINAMKPVGND